MLSLEVIDILVQNYLSYYQLGTEQVLGPYVSEGARVNDCQGPLQFRPRVGSPGERRARAAYGSIKTLGLSAELQLLQQPLW